MSLVRDAKRSITQKTVYRAHKSLEKEKKLFCYCEQRPCMLVSILKKY